MHIYTSVIPLAITAFVILIFILMPIKPELLGKDGLLAAALSIISTLPGFYFAGLAAVATFGGPYMDQVMPDPAPSIKVKIQGAWLPLDLSRRQFLSYLFSYLTLLSFVACLLIIGLNAAEGSIDLFQSHLETVKYGSEIWVTLKFLGGASITAILSSIVVTTLHGLFFLTEKIHQA